MASLTFAGPANTLAGPEYGVFEHVQVKESSYTVSEQESDGPVEGEIVTKGHTVIDRGDMNRMGKRQEFKRNFGFWAAFGFTSIYIATWEYLLVSVYSGLVNGGFAGLIYEFIGTTICYTTIVVSLAEMASMAPTSGGNYHWVSEFAPSSLQKHLSYVAGWLSALGWLAGVVSGTYIMATLTEALIQVTMPDYAFTQKESTGVMLAFVIVTVLFNSFGSPLLPWIEKISLVGHILGAIVTVVLLWVLVPEKNSAHDVFVSVVDSGGWGNIGLSCLVGTVATLYCQLRPDAAVHIAEEVRQASVALPRCIVWGYLYNAVLGFVVLVTILFTVGSLEDAIDASAPFQNAFTATGSKGVNMFLTLVLFLLILSGNITAVTTTSRETWAFARDGGLPFSHWLAKVNKRWNAPLNAVWITTIFTIALCLINLGSTIAFNIIISLNLVSFLGTYFLSIGCILHRRIVDPSSLPPSHFSLGRYGIPINAFACIYCIFAFVFSCFPVELPVDPASANYAPAIFAGVMLLAGVSWVFQGRKIYEGPVVYVEGRHVDGQEEGDGVGRRRVLQGTD